MRAAFVFAPVLVSCLPAVAQTPSVATQNNVQGVQNNVRGAQINNSGTFTYRSGDSTIQNPIIIGGKSVTIVYRNETSISDEQKAPELGLEIVSAKASESEALKQWPNWGRGSKNTVLDITLLNRMPLSAATTRAVIHIKRVWLDKSPWTPSYRTVSWNYDVVLPVSGQGCAIEIENFNQDVPPNGTDRFTITVGNDLKGSYDWFLYQISIEIFYNGDRSVSSPDLVFLSPSEANMLARNANPSRFYNAFKRNYVTAQEIKSSGGVLSAAVRRWIEDKDNQIPAAIKVVLNEKEKVGRRLSATQFLASVGGVANSVLPELKSASIKDPKIADAVLQAVSEIERSASERIDTSFFRQDGHVGCTPAPSTQIQVTKEDAAAENSQRDRLEKEENKYSNGADVRILSKKAKNKH